VSLRLLEIIVPTDRAEAVRAILDEGSAAGAWAGPAGDGRAALRVVLDSADAEGLIDRLGGELRDGETARLLLFALEATLPRLPEPEPSEPEPSSTEADGNAGDAADAADAAASGAARRGPARISREELYDDVTAGLATSRTFLLTVALSTIVAAVGLLRDNVAVIIGAMVIAPLLSPNIALALATTLGDAALVRRSIRTNVFGVTLAFVLSVLVGLCLPVDPTVSEIASRTLVRPGDVVLALASGAAGALAFTTGAPAALVGVMVAVALLPPLATVGLLIGTGAWPEIRGAVLLLATNVVSVNLAAVVTFLAQGIRPGTWWEAERARRATRRAIAAWSVILATLVVLIVLGVRPE